MDQGAQCYQRYLQGKDEALVELIELYKDGLILYLYSYVNHFDIAEDLCEDTFFRLIVKKPKYSGRSSFKTWLYAIARHIAIDYLRHHVKERAVPLEDLEGMFEIEQLQQTYLKETDKICVHQALAKLHEDYRSILYLVYFEGFSNQEAALILHKNERQIRNLLYRARQALKHQLEQEEYHEDIAGNGRTFN